MRAIIVAALLTSLATSAGAQSSTGNLPPDFYPQPKCEKPQPPGKTPEPQNQQAVQAYNGKVRAFNGQAQAFNVCMKEYSDKAQNDINALLATVHTAIAAANQ